jgi:hypothetical protein
MGACEAADYARLVSLAALWGAAFVFLRVAAPVLGPIWTAEFRVLLGALALLAWFRLTGVDAGLRRHARFLPADRHGQHRAAVRAVFLRRDARPGVAAFDCELDGADFRPGLERSIWRRAV